MTSKTTWESVQWLRGLAAAMVVWHHIREQFDVIKDQFPSGIGGSGVDIFFAISGFIMMLIAKPGQPAREFLLKRIVRVAPLYWAATFALAAVCFIAPSVLKSVKFTWPHLAQSLLFIPHYAEDGRIRPLLSLGWTLNYEMFFYLVFACFIFLAPLRRLIAVAATLLVFIAAGEIFSSRNPAWLTYTQPIMLEFVGGMTLAYLVTRGLKANRAFGLAVLGLGLGLLVVGYFLSGQGYERALIYGVPALLIVSGGVLLEPWWPKVPPLVLLGDASYSLYLSHIFTLGALRAVWSKLGLPVEGVSMAAFIFAGLAMSIAVGVAIHLLVERPFNRWSHRRLHTPPSRPAVEPDHMPRAS